jgi:hypothetical protein
MQQVLRLTALAVLALNCGAAFAGRTTDCLITLRMKAPIMPLMSRP